MKRTSRWGKVRASVFKQSRRSPTQIPKDQEFSSENPMLVSGGEDLYPAMYILRLIFTHYSQRSASKGGLDIRLFMRFIECCPQLLVG